MQTTQLLTLTLALSLAITANAQLDWGAVTNSASLQSGEGTFYGEGQDSQGTCSYSQNFANTNDLAWSSGTDLTVALNDAQFSDSAACGMCIRFRGTGAGLGTTPIPSSWTNGFVNNRCPECAHGDVDLASAGDGRWNIEWYAVPCEVGSTPLQYDIVVSSYYWFSLVVSNTRVPITSVSVNIGGSWLVLKRTNNNQWAYYNTNGPWQSNFPMGIRVTSIEGQTVEDSITTVTGNAGTVQFSGDGSSSSSAVSTTPASTTPSVPPAQETPATPATPPVQAATPPTPASTPATPPAPSAPLVEGGFYIDNYQQCGGSGGACNNEPYTSAPCEDAAWAVAVCKSTGFACSRTSAEIYTCLPGVAASPPPVVSSPPVGAVPPPVGSVPPPVPSTTTPSVPPTAASPPPSPTQQVSPPVQAAAQVSPPAQEQAGILLSSSTTQSPPPSPTATTVSPPTPTSTQTAATPPPPSPTDTSSAVSSASLAISAGGQCGGTSQCEPAGTPTDKVTCNNGPWAGAYCPASYSCMANPGPLVWTCMPSSTATAGRRLLGRQ